ncbi:unnamed protein product, partial [marine sediment metagenome]
MRRSDKWLRRQIRQECSFIMRDNVKYVRESNLLILLDEREKELKKKLATAERKEKEA